MSTPLTSRERRAKRKLRKAEVFLKSGYLATLSDPRGQQVQAWVVPMTRQQVENLVASQPISEGTR